MTNLMPVALPKEHYISILHKGVHYRFYGRNRWYFWKQNNTWFPINGAFVPGEVLQAAVRHPDFVPEGENHV